MRVFVTGATGFIGAAVVKELISAGHKVLGLARSDEAAKSLAAAGAETHRGNIEDLESLRSGAAAADGVIHLGFNHDFSKFIENCENDKRAIEAMGSVFVGSDRPILITSGTGIGLMEHGKPATEDGFNTDHPNPRIASELAANAILACGVNVSVVRLPQVHDTAKQGLISFAIPIAREKGVSAYIGDGRNRWPAAHASDVARLYRLALEKHEKGARYHAVAEEGVTMREIAETIGRGLKVPVKSISAEEVQAHFGWLAMFAGFDMPASSAITRKKLGWNPTGPGLIADLDRMNYA
ncbi:MAG: SDR family oxidoreductase [Burkholderiaceae bacterium]|nr:SDR family oxidoreductase [Burkholderiaceae bacterium]